MLTLTSDVRVPRARLPRILVAAAMCVGAGANAQTQATTPAGPDPLLDLFVKKGFVTQDEANQVKAEADAMRTNGPVVSNKSKWIISDGIKSVELFGDLRLRYEDRDAEAPGGAQVKLKRERYAVRLGLRGDVADDFYYGLRLDTAANPRSPWVTFGTSSSTSPYQGPFGKSQAGLNIGEVYIGWHPESWVDITVGKMPMPLYTTAMVWDTDINPEGAAERFKYSVGQADFFATFGQFLYADFNPSSASGGLGFNGETGQNTDQLFLIAYQAGFTYHFSTNTYAKIAATTYQYVGQQRSTLASGSVTSPYFGDPYVGEGGYLGPGTGTTQGQTTPVTGFVSQPGYQSVGFANNQVGVDHLSVVEIPFEVDFKLSQLDARFFGDVAYNFDGSKRAEDAATGYGVYLSHQPTTTPTIKPFSPQRDDVKAYQLGFAIASPNNLGMVYGASAKRHGWELRTYWQHVEQYALDPNLLDSDFFEGRGNLEGIYVAAAYGFTGNVIGTVRYGYASRINDKLGTGGSNQDIPQINPINHYNLLQMDLTLHF